MIFSETGTILILASCRLHNEAGEHAWLIHAHRLKLPKDLLPRSFVFIDALQGETASIRLACGITRNLPYANLDYLHEYFLEEQWIPETDPRAQAHLLKKLEEESEQPVLDGAGEAAKQYIDQLEWILRRNHVRIDEGPSVALVR